MGSRIKSLDYWEINLAHNWLAPTKSHVKTSFLIDRVLTYIFHNIPCPKNIFFKRKIWIFKKIKNVFIEGILPKGPYLPYVIASPFIREVFFSFMWTLFCFTSHVKYQTREQILSIKCHIYSKQCNSRGMSCLCLYMNAEKSLICNELCFSFPQTNIMICLITNLSMLFANVWHMSIAIFLDFIAASTAVTALQIMEMNSTQKHQRDYH